MPDHPVPMRDKLCTASIDITTSTSDKKNYQRSDIKRTNINTNTITNTISAALSSLIYHALTYTICMIVLAFLLISTAQILSISAPLWIAWLIGVLCAAAVYEAWWEIGGWAEEGGEW